jgi:hypothetical protein
LSVVRFLFTELFNIQANRIILYSLTKFVKNLEIWHIPICIRVDSQTISKSFNKLLISKLEILSYKMIFSTFCYDFLQLIFYKVTLSWISLIFGRQNRWCFNFGVECIIYRVSHFNYDTEIFWNIQINAKLYQTKVVGFKEGHKRTSLSLGLSSGSAAKVRSRSNGFF